MLSAHAQIRMQQRGVPTKVIRWLLDYGSTMHDGHGAEIRTLDRRALGRIAAAEGPVALKQHDQKLNSYLVESKGRVITVGRRFKRIRNR